MKTSRDPSSLCPPPLAAGQAAQRGRMRRDEEDRWQPGEAPHSGCCRWNKLKPLHLTAMSNACACANGGKPSGTGRGRTSRSAVFLPVCAASRFLVSMETSCCRTDVMKKTSKIKANKQIRFALTRVEGLITLLPCMWRKNSSREAAGTPETTCQQ